MDIKPYNTVCNFNPKWVDNGTCTLKLIARNRVRFNVDYDLFLPMKNVTIHLQFFKFYNQFRPFLMNDWANLCSALSNISPYNFFIKTLLRQTTKYSNMNNCYHAVGVHYQLRNADIPPQFFGLFMDPGKYKVELHVYEGYPYDTVGNWSVSFDISENFKKISKSKKN
ncbi:hypothetical protein ACFFRR_002407 [Megaselia abdita]